MSRFAHKIFRNVSGGDIWLSLTRGSEGRKVSVSVLHDPIARSDSAKPFPFGYVFTGKLASHRRRSPIFRAHICRVLFSSKKVSFLSLCFTGCCGVRDLWSFILPRLSISERTRYFPQVKANFSPKPSFA